MRYWASSNVMVGVRHWYPFWNIFYPVLLNGRHADAHCTQLRHLGRQRYHACGWQRWRLSGGTANRTRTVCARTCATGYNVRHHAVHFVVPQVKIWPGSSHFLIRPQKNYFTVFPRLARGQPDALVSCHCNVLCYYRFHALSLWDYFFASSHLLLLQLLITWACILIQSVKR